MGIQPDLGSVSSASFRAQQGLRVRPHCPAPWEGKEGPDLHAGDGVWVGLWGWGSSLCVGIWDFGIQVFAGSNPQSSEPVPVNPRLSPVVLSAVPVLGMGFGSLCGAGDPPCGIPGLAGGEGTAEPNRAL